MLVVYETSTSKYWLYFVKAVAGNLLYTFDMG
jgi:hypothetical protein